MKPPVESKDNESSEGREIGAGDITRAMNEWMRRYTDDPSSFEAEFQTVTAFLTETSEGKEPSYGQTSAAFIFKLLDDLNAAG